MQNWKPFYCFCSVDIQSIDYVMSETVIGQIDMVQFKNMFEIIKEKIGEKYLFVQKFSAVICPGGASTWFAKVISFWHLV